MVSETGRRVPRAGQDTGLRRGRRYELAGRVLPELASAVFLARILGARKKYFLTLCELKKISIIKRMADIREGFVYVITRTNKTDDDYTDIYVGSTSRALNLRLSEHRCNVTRVGNENNKLYKKMRAVGIQSWEIIPLLSRTCDKKAILELEKKWCKIIGADLNTLSPIRTPDEKRQYDANYRELNRDVVSQYMANYFKKNKESKRYHCNVCDLSFEHIGNLQRHLKTLKHGYAYLKSLD